jgi:hypothetical protein
MQTPLLSIDTFPGSDPDVPPVQNWYYVMVQNGPDEGPFWQWAKNAKYKAKNASAMTNSKATLWEWHLIHKQWNRILWYMPGDEYPYTHGDYGFSGSQSQADAPKIDPTSGGGSLDVVKKDETGGTILPYVIGGGILLTLGWLILSKKS